MKENIMNKDFHIHLKAGVEDYSIMNEYIQTCLKKHIYEVTFLDHGYRESIKHTPVLCTPQIVKSFLKNIQRARADNKNIVIKSGIEIDFSENSDFNYKQKQITDIGFDYVVGSVHGYNKFSHDEYYRRNIKMLETTNIDILGHLQLWDDYMEYDKEICKIVKLCKENDVTIEINTSSRSIWNKEKFMYMMEMIEKFDVKTCIGSDAHNQDEIAQNYNIIKEYIK